LTEKHDKKIAVILNEFGESKYGKGTGQWLGLSFILFFLYR
jgi:G3E family GTPase